MRSLVALALSTVAAMLLAGAVSAENFTQPVLWQDLPDTDIIRIDDVYYYSASNMHFSPGAPILRSYDLVNWEYLSHSVPVYDFDPRFSLQNGTNAYNWGVYASSLRYNEATRTFYWIGCIQQLGHTYVYEAPDIEGPWKRTSTIANYCYYDDGLLIDDDGSMYVSYGKWVADGNQAQIWVAQLTGDLQNKKSQTVFHTTPDVGYIEGTRFYKINGTYYILLTNPGVGNGEIILKSSGGPFGPYSTWHRILKNNGNPVPGASSPYQGAIVETQHGDWWYMAFVNSYPGARIPVLAPLTWDANGWPNVQFASGDKWGSTYPYPLPKHPVKPITGTDTFASSTLGPQYEWNHNPDDSKWAVGGGLTLRTATARTTSSPPATPYHTAPSAPGPSRPSSSTSRASPTATRPGSPSSGTTPPGSRCTRTALRTCACRWSTGSSWTRLAAGTRTKRAPSWRMRTCRTRAPSGCASASTSAAVPAMPTSRTARTGSNSRRSVGSTSWPTARCSSWGTGSACSTLRLSSWAARRLLSRRLCPRLSPGMC